jgi:2-(1,2-epoxy-1,2-dihydrophenyl)acetyl-CoA isomerase
MNEKIELVIKDNIAIIRLMDPENFNPLNKNSGKRLLETIESVRNNSVVRCLIITGSGKAFSAGGDIKQFKASIENGTSGQVMDDLTRDLYKIALILRLYPKPVIASVNGWAVGAGMNLALSCDFIIASEKARFVNEIVPHEDLEEISLQWAERLAKGPTLTFARTKKLFFDALSSPLEEHLENERQMQVKSAESEDYKIGVFALNEKKDPKFIGK